MSKYSKHQILKKEEEEKVFLFHRQPAHSYPDIKESYKKKLDIDIKNAGEVKLLHTELLDTADIFSVLLHSRKVSNEVSLAMCIILKILQSDQYKFSKLKRFKDVMVLFNGLIRKEAEKLDIDKRKNFKLCPETIRKAFKLLKKIGILNYEVKKLRAKKVDGIRSVRGASLTPLGFKFIHMVIREGFSFKNIMSLGHHVERLAKNLRERKDYIINLLLAPLNKVGGRALYKVRRFYSQYVCGLGLKQEYKLYRDAVNRYVIPAPPI